ncbi:dimethyl sulfoxide reductase anchor subunit family protein [Raoultibacter phocaeensis]|uniref:dimethyl sulfoxide reductase anchor subunit family protein n=1 Tax=Raoultibacter phocaeensis TaxID=2479841 RepID=UPI001117B4B5|nr:DmsC/YnfH family molybdoenzyme membrane anchor subunit [Raoultibacter phocaeensis]
MGSGFETALGEITLVLFTTLAPSGVFAFMIMSAALARGKIDGALRRRIDQFLCIPLMVSMIGLVASATHLGNPANALYVFMGVGRSPLSTEVFCAVVFLMLAGVYWLYSFSQKPRIGLQRAWSVAIIVAGAAFITAVAFAYDAETIVSWNTAFVPLNLWLNALVGGPLLAVAALRGAKADFVAGSFGRAMCLCAAVALVANTAGFALQGAEYPGMVNAFGTAADLVPAYGLLVAVFFVCCALGIALDFAALSKGKLPSLGTVIASCALVLAGIFVMRFAFYMVHMTIGLA